MKKCKARPLSFNVNPSMRGFTLIHLIIAIVVAIILGILGYCAISAAATTSLSATIAGPATIAPNANGSFTVTATYSRALTAGVTLKVLIYEDDFGNELLSSNGRIRIPRGGTTGTFTTRLGMSDSCAISGTSGTGDEEDEHEVFVELELIGTPPLNTDSAAVSINVDVKCE